MNAPDGARTGALILFTQRTMFTYLITLLLSASASSSVLIVGDSQAGNTGWGGAIDAVLEADGLEVDRYSFPGYSNRRLNNEVRRIQGLPDYDVVILISGDNDSTDQTSYLEDSLQTLGAHGASVYYSLPMNRTVIGNMNLFRVIFPSHDVTPTFWVEGDGAEWFAGYREHLRFVAQGSAMLIDPEQIAIANEINIPVFPDGIHIPRRFALELAQHL
jgi:hypothetical protein